MLGIIIPIIVSWHVYKTAKENGRNGILWAVINFVAFFGTQLLFGAIAGVSLALYFAMQGLDDSMLETAINQWNIPISFLSLIAGGIASWLVVRHVTRVPEEQFYPQPPPPPNFNQQ